MATVTKGFTTRLANRPFQFWCSGTLALNCAHQSARKSKLKVVG